MAVSKVFNPTPWRTFRSAAQTRRVSFRLGNSDSNAAYGNEGWHGGWMWTMGQRDGCWASPLSSPGVMNAEGLAVTPAFFTFVGTSATIPLLPAVVVGTATSVTSGSNIVTDAGASWLSTLSVGQMIRFSTNWYRVVSIDSDTQIHVSENVGSTASGLTTTAYALPPAGAYAFVDPGAFYGGLRPHQYAYLAAGQTYAEALGLQAMLVSPMKKTGNVKGIFSYVQFPGGAGGSFKPQVRRMTSPYQSSQATISTNSPDGDYHIATTTLTLNSGYVQEGESVAALWSNTTGAQITGPFMGLFCKLIDTTATKGVAVSMLGNRSGQASDQMLLDLQRAPVAYRRHFMEMEVYDQGADPILGIEIQTGLNDSAILDRATFKANIEAILAIYDADWVALGYDLANLVYLLRVSHDTGFSPPDNNLAIYREVMEEICTANPTRCTAVDMSQIMAQAEMAGRNLFNATDLNGRLHLRTAANAYRVLTDMVDDAIMAPLPGQVLTSAGGTLKRHRGT
jgi:hypothetical protein